MIPLPRVAPGAAFSPIPIRRGTRVFVLTGAGISAESGIRTFRDAGGLWEQHRIEDVATSEGFLRRRPRCDCGALLRPDVVWFGEIPKGMDEIGAAVASCDLFVTVGSSGAVYPAAGLASHVRNFPSVRTGRFARTVYVGLERPENAH